MLKPLHAAIFGAGSIGGLIDSPNSTNTASHAHAYVKEPACLLTAICEPDMANQKEFQKRWGKVNTYSDCKALLENENINILSIASPTKYHVQNIEEALQSDTVSHILCEKPLVNSLQEFQALRPEIEKSNKKILINFMRRYDPSFIELASLIKSQKWGETVNFHGTFTKGLLHNGSHMLAMLSHLFGTLKTLNCTHAKPTEDDLCGEFLVQCEKAQGTLSCMKDIEYSVFELSIWFENAKVQIKDGGSDISIHVKKPSPLYKGYFVLEFERTLKNSLLHYASNSLTFLLEQESALCKKILDEHLNIHEIIFNTINKARQS